MMIEYSLRRIANGYLVSTSITTFAAKPMPEKFVKTLDEAFEEIRKHEAPPKARADFDRTYYLDTHV